MEEQLIPPAGIILIMIFLIALVLTALIVLAWFCMHFLKQDLQVSSYTLWFENLPDGFDNLKIAMLSDLHSNTVPGLRHRIVAAKPDLIVCTGDVFDGCQGEQEAYALLEKIVPAAPVYFISGNHEQYLPSWPYWKKKVEELGIHFLDDHALKLKRNGQSLELAGLQDPGRQQLLPPETLMNNFYHSLHQLPAKTQFRILLMHRASLFEQVPAGTADLILSGHEHGGHWRVCGVGLIGPGNERKREIFPKYTCGIYGTKEQRMLVSRGLGDHIRIPRFNNRPELVLMTLKKGSKKDQVQILN